MLRRFWLLFILFFLYRICICGVDFVFVVLFLYFLAACTFLDSALICFVIFWRLVFCRLLGCMFFVFVGGLYFSGFWVVFSGWVAPFLMFVFVYSVRLSEGGASGEECVPGAPLRISDTCMWREIWPQRAPRVRGGAAAPPALASFTINLPGAFRKAGEQVGDGGGCGGGGGGGGAAAAVAGAGAAGA